MKRTLSLVSLLGCLSLGGASLFAQGIITGKVAGTVVDPTGAVIPGATIVAATFSVPVGSISAFMLCQCGSRLSAL